jgi:hypothetical protein
MRHQRQMTAMNQMKTDSAFGAICVFVSVLAFLFKIMMDNINTIFRLFKSLQL